MDQETNQDVSRCEASDAAGAGGMSSRRSFLKMGLGGLVCLGAGGTAAYYALTRGGSRIGARTASDVFRDDAPKGELWELWQARGWAKEARHYLKLGENVQCKLCPNDCLLAPEDRGRCRNRVNKGGTLYTLAYANACSLNLDPIEKKPLFHFLPGTTAFSFASSGCGFRCLNCQNWDISQRKPEETKDPRGPALRLRPERLASLTRNDLDRLSVLPEDVIALAEHLGSASIAYTYSEPTSWYEYMYDTAAHARRKGLKNVWVTCGYIEDESLEELVQVLDAVHVDLKSFDEGIYRTLNSGKLRPILNTLRALKRAGVWLEVSNLIVPTYTDKPDMIRRMCDWLLANLGPDCPLHFLRFHPQHKLTNLPPTPLEILREAQAIARRCGMHYVYLGNARGVEDAETTLCPNCHKPVVQRDMFAVDTANLKQGHCRACGAAIAGVWTNLA